MVHYPQHIVYGRAGVIIQAGALRFFLPIDRPLPTITEAPISADVLADGMRRSLVALTLRSAPVGPSSAGPGRTPFGPTTQADLKVGATTVHRPIGSRVRCERPRPGHGTRPR